MSINYFIELLGGLALFLYGMEMMSSGLELVAGDRLRVVIEKMTSSFFKSIIVGALVTAVIQSSSATTVMVVGFVNAGLMTIYQSVGIIMGANIGTTITGQLVALNISTLAPIIAFIGFLMSTFSKSKKKRYVGQAVIGLGFLFMGMEFMSDSMEPLRDYPGFSSIMTKFDNPVLGVLVGTGITALLQSSSASLGILQAVANQGVISLHSAMYIILGFNIGTCVTSVLSSVGSSKNARRTALVHVLFNIIGTMIFILVSFFVPIDEIVMKFSRNLPAAEIANLHTIFNIATTIILIPFSKKLADLAFKIIPGIDKEQEEMSLQYINLNVTKDAPATFTDVKAEVGRLLDIVTMNYESSVELLREFDDEKYDEIFRREGVINYLNKQISAFIIDSLGLQMNKQTSANFASYLRISRDMERIGDHSKNIAEVAKLKNDEGLLFTDVTFDEMREINTIIEEMFHSYDGNMEKDQRVVFMRESNELVQKEASDFRNNHMIRMREKICNPESGLLYEKTLAAMERVSSYISNAGKLSI